VLIIWAEERNFIALQFGDPVENNRDGLLALC